MPKERKKRGKTAVRKLSLVVFCLLVIAGGIYMLLPRLGGLKYRNDVLESCRVSTGGGMLGGHSEYCLKTGEEGDVILEVSFKETHADRMRTDVYKASEKDLQHIHAIVNERDLFAASKKRYSKMQVLDGDTTTLSFDYSGGYFSISSEQVLSSGMRKGWSDVIEYLHSLATGEHESFLEPQTARLLADGYNLMYLVEDAFDGKLDGVLSEQHEVSRFEDCGIVFAAAKDIDLSVAEPAGETAAAGTLIYESESGRMILLYADHTFEGPVYLLAKLDGYVDSACPILEKMEGPYRFYLN